MPNDNVLDRVREEKSATRVNTKKKGNKSSMFYHASFIMPNTQWWQYGVVVVRWFRSISPLHAGSR